MTNAQWYADFEMHLMTDASPSVYFNALQKNRTFPRHHPFDWLIRLKDVPQSPKHHPEGDVWKHTMLVVDGAAGCRGQSREPNVLMWAALLHDLGKIPATKMRRGRWTAYDHDKMGRGMAEEFLRACGCDEGFLQRVAALVRWHMQPLFVAKDMPFADIAAMVDEVDTHEVGLLALADRLGRGFNDAETVAKETRRIETFVEKCRKHAAKTGVR